MSGDSILENDYPKIEKETPKEEIVPVIPLKDEKKILFKPENHSESQCRYAVSLLGDLGKETSKNAKDKLCKEIICYFELAANNPKNRISNAMYYLGDIYMVDKLRVKKDEEHGLNYLKLAANVNKERAIALLKKLFK
ncbi:kinase-like protein [Gigaspora margarita]|uniref:Kinase-like protein n=1 Tax=Gigaspora margarita TaxID=4874 RepID=A0A8H4AEK8_GIGMA|nr:kinase-like protein [Gigaspora margarita]